MKDSVVTFSKRIKNEIALGSYSHEQEKAILSGFVRYQGTMSLVPTLSLRLSSSLASVAKFIYTCFKDVYEVQPKFTYTKQLRLGKNLVYHIQIENKTAEMLKDLEISQGLQTMYPHETISKDNLQGFVIGTFLASGQISDPKTGHYFCELGFNDEKTAKLLLTKMNSFKDIESMGFKVIKRRAKYILYLKRSDQISMFISYLGAISMMFEFENTRLERDYFNNENRLTICAQANYSKSLKTGESNIADLNVLEEKMGKVYFNPHMMLLADLRRSNKDSSYQELAAMASKKGYSVTKSGVAHIFSKFAYDAKKYAKKL
jgi:DNA-binding protein WhiA